MLTREQFSFVEEAQIAYKFKALLIEKNRSENMQKSSFYHIIKA